MKPRRCREPECGALIAFLVNPETQRPVPVDADSLSGADVVELEADRDVLFRPRADHVSHFKTCKSPRRFSKGRR